MYWTPAAGLGILRKGLPPRDSLCGRRPTRQSRDCSLLPSMTPSQVRWALKGFDASRIEGARCQEERMRSEKARDRVEQLLASGRSEIAVYPEGRTPMKGHQRSAKH